MAPRNSARNLTHTRILFSFSFELRYFPRYVKECRKHCADLHAIVQTFKVNRDLIERNCRRIATTLLINIEKNYVYEEGVFEQRQSDHRGAVRQTMEDSHAMIKDTMLHMYDKDSLYNIQCVARNMYTEIRYEKLHTET